MFGDSSELAVKVLTRTLILTFYASTAAAFSVWTTIKSNSRHLTLSVRLKMCFLRDVVLSVASSVACDHCHEPILLKRAGLKLNRGEIPAKSRRFDHIGIVSIADFVDPWTISKFSLPKLPAIGFRELPLIVCEAPLCGLIKNY